MNLYKKPPPLTLLPYRGGRSGYKYTYFLYQKKLYPFYLKAFLIRAAVSASTS